MFGCVSSSKTMTAAAAVLWWLNAFYPSRVFSTAPTFRQVEINLWGEVGKLHRNAKIPIGGALLTTELKLDRDWYALGFATDKPDYLHGIHGPNDLIIVDEAQGIPQEIFDAIENTMAGGNTRFVGLCNPNVVSGEVYDALGRKKDIYNSITISAFDTPNVKQGRIVIPGMITKEQVEEWIRVYGEDSDFCRVKVFAKFPKQEADSLIPVSWFEAAVERARTMTEPVGVHRRLGVDVARFGDDSTTFIQCNGRVVQPIVKSRDILNGKKTTEVVEALKLRHITGKISQILVDEIGVGGGVVDQLEEKKYPVFGVTVSEKSYVTVKDAKGEDKPKFNNLRSQLWWQAREALDPECPLGAYGIRENNDELKAELCSAKWTVDSAGRIVIESKEKMKERLGRSPDLADAFCLALHDPKPPYKKPATVMLQGLALAGTSSGRGKADWM